MDGSPNIKITVIVGRTDRHMKKGHIGLTRATERNMTKKTQDISDTIT